MEGTYPTAVVVKATSYYVQGFQFSKAFKMRKWDGKKHLFNQNAASMPAGLAHHVKEALLTNDKLGTVEIIDETVYPEPEGSDYELIGITFGQGVYDYQLAAAEEMVAQRKGVIKIATNGGKTEIACAVTQRLRLPTLFLVERIELLRQTRERFAKRLGIPESSIGMIGDGKFSLGDWITVSTPKSLKNKMFSVDMDFWQVVFCDECHHVGSDTFFDVLNALPAPYRYGMSGTPLDRGDGADLRLLAQTGPVLYEVSNKLLVERGISVPPRVEMVMVDKPIFGGKGMTYGDVEKKGVVENDHLNAEVVSRALEHARAGKQVLVLVEKIDHGKRIAKGLEGSDFKFISGREKSETRKKVLDKFKAGEIRILVATTILDEGVDVPCIDVLILAAGGKAKIRLLQRVGRGLRTGDGKQGLHVIDFANFTHKWLLKHSLARLQMYKAEECFVINTAD